MSNLFKKIFVSFAVLSVVIWSSGISAFAQESNDNEQDSSDHQKINICHKSDHHSDDKDHSHDNPWQAIRVSVNGWDGHSNHPSDYVYAGPVSENGRPDNEDHMADLWCLNNAPEDPVEPAICGDGQINSDAEQCDDGNTVSGDGCSATCQIETPEPPATTRSQWCSALLGIMQSPMDDNQVIDLNNNPEDVLNDSVLMSTWYAEHNDTACYNRFDLGDGIYNFNQENYQNIDWCAGLKQGVMDYIGTSTTTPEFSTIFDLNHDGVINLSDTPILAGLLAAGDQAACYAYYVPPMPTWPDNPEICETVDHAVTYNPYPTCGAATCEEGYHAVEGSCVADENPTCPTVDHATSYSPYPTCSVTACESGYVLTGGTCVAEQRSSGGGGGGGIIPLNIFNVQNSLIGNSANITWETSRQSLTWMLYGTSTSYGSEYQSVNYNTAHTLALTDLEPGTTYHYQIRAKDSANNSTYDIDRTFTTLGTFPQVLGIKENACTPDVDGDIKGVMQFIAGSLIRGCGPEVYHVLGNNVYHIPSWQYLHDHYFAQRIYNVTDEVIAQYGQTMTDDTSVRGNGVKKVAGAKIYPDGTLLKTSDGKIYVIINGRKVHIVSLEELKKYAGHKMYVVSDEVLNQY